MFGRPSDPKVNLWSVTRRAVPVSLLLLAAVAHSTARDELSFYVLLVAIPLVAVAGLGELGELLDLPGPVQEQPLAALQAMLWGAALGLMVVATSARAGVLEGAPVGAVGDAALVGCVAALSVEGVLALVAHVRQPIGWLTAAQAASRSGGSRRRPA